MLLNTRPCSTCARPVDGALGIVGGAVVHGADEGLLIEIGRHVAVWRQGRLELGIHLSRVAGVRAVKPCRHEKHNQTVHFFSENHKNRSTFVASAEILLLNSFTLYCSKL